MKKRFNSLFLETSKLTCLSLVSVTNRVVFLLIVIIVSALVSVLPVRLDVSVFSITPAFVFFSIFLVCVLLFVCFDVLIEEKQKTNGPFLDTKRLKATI